MHGFLPHTRRGHTTILQTRDLQEQHGTIWRNKGRQLCGRLHRFSGKYAGGLAPRGQDQGAFCRWIIVFLAVLSGLSWVFTVVRTTLFSCAGTGLGGTAWNAGLSSPPYHASPGLASSIETCSSSPLVWWAVSAVSVSTASPELLASCSVVWEQMRRSETMRSCALGITFCQYSKILPA